MQFTTHIVIERPIREVFAFASNPCCWTEWITGAAPVQHTWSGQLDVGTTFRQAAPLASFWDDTSWEVTEYQPSSSPVGGLARRAAPCACSARHWAAQRA